MSDYNFFIYINCDCYRNGKTKQPSSYEENVNYTNYGIKIKESYYKTDDEIYYEFERWISGACVHPMMILEESHFCEMHELIEFKEDLIMHGSTRFANLIKILSRNDKHFNILYDEISKIDEEIIDFTANNYKGKKILLRRKDNYKIASTNEHSVTYFDYDDINHEIYGLEKEGFFILKRKGESYEKSIHFNNFTQDTWMDLKDELYLIQGESTFFEPSVGQLSSDLGLELTDPFDISANEEFFVSTESINLNEHYHLILKTIQRYLNLSALTKNNIIIKRHPPVMKHFQKYLTSNNFGN